jgi:hypothetical protein
MGYNRSMGAMGNGSRVVLGHRNKVVMHGGI